MKTAHVRGLDEYSRIYNESIKDPAGFWDKVFQFKQQFIVRGTNNLLFVAVDDLAIHSLDGEGAFEVELTLLRRDERVTKQSVNKHSTHTQPMLNID